MFTRLCEAQIVCFEYGFYTDVHSGKAIIKLQNKGI